MSKYNAYKNPDGNGYLLDVQSDILEDMETRVVVPLLPASLTPPATRLNPVFEIDGKDYIMLTQALAAFPASLLKSPVANFADRFDEITNALDMLFQGY